MYTPISPARETLHDRSRPRYLYMSVQHQEALAHLLYGLQSGWRLRPGSPARWELARLPSAAGARPIPEQADIAVIFNPITVVELLKRFCDELQFRAPQRQRQVLSTSSTPASGTSCGRKTVLIIDEAQSFPPSARELRLLTNLETDAASSCRSSCSASPNCAHSRRPRCASWRSGITARYHLGR